MLGVVAGSVPTVFFAMVHTKTPHFAPKLLKLQTNLKLARFADASEPTPPHSVMVRTRKLVKSRAFNLGRSRSLFFPNPSSP
jgi:hypothetical protein